MGLSETPSELSGEVPHQACVEMLQSTGIQGVQGANPAIGRSLMYLLRRCSGYRRQELRKLGKHPPDLDCMPEASTRKTRLHVLFSCERVFLLCISS